VGIKHAATLPIEEILEASLAYKPNFDHEMDDLRTKNALRWLVYADDSAT